MVGISLTKISSPKLQVQRRHFRHQLGGLQTLFGAHAGGAAGRGDQDRAGTGFLNGGQDLGEAGLGLGGRAVVLADMDMDDSGAGVVGSLGLADHFFLGVGNGGVMLFGNFRAADGSGDDQFFHNLTSKGLIP